MHNAKTHYEQMPVTELMKKIAEEQLETEKVRTTTAVAKKPSRCSSRHN